MVKGMFYVTNIIECVQQGTAGCGFFLTNNMVFKSVFYKRMSRIPLLFEIAVRLHQVHMREYLNLHVVHIVVTRMIEAVIYGVSRADNLG